MAGKIFISYRREDEQGYAVRLYEHMSESFGKEQLFFDVDSIPPGFDFVKYIEKQIALSDIVLVVIGRNWLNASDENGRRRLDNPEDFVRVEIESALKQDKHVIPVLVQGAPMPLSTQLPKKLQPLARRNAFFATHVGFRAEVARLVAALETTLEAFAQSRLTEQERVLEEARQRDAERAETALHTERAAAEQDRSKREEADRLKAAAQAALKEEQRRERERADAEKAAQDAAELRRATDREEAERAAASERYFASYSSHLQGRLQKGQAKRIKLERPAAARSFGSRFLLALLFMSAIVIVGVGVYLGFDAVSSWAEAKTTIPPTIAAAPPAAEGPLAVQPEAILGMTIADAPESTVASFGVEDRKEATIVTDIDRNKPAFRAGIKIGFLILKVNGVDKFSRRQVLEAVAEAIRNEDAPVVFTMRSSWMNHFDVTKTVEFGRQ